MSQLALLLAKLKQSGADRVFFVPNEPGYTLDGSVKRPLPGGALRPALLLDAISELLSGDDLAGLSSHRARIVRHEHEGEEFVLEVLRDVGGVSFNIRKARPLRDSVRRDEPRRDEPRRDEPRRDEPRRDEPKPTPVVDTSATKPRLSKRMRAAVSQRSPPVVSDKRTVRAILDDEGNLVDPVDPLSAPPSRDPKITKPVKSPLVAEAGHESSPSEPVTRSVVRDVAREVVLDVARELLQSLSRVGEAGGGESATLTPALQRLGRRIRELRMERDLTVEEVSGKASLDKAHFASIEQGQTSPPFASLLAIARALDVTLSELVRGV